MSKEARDKEILERHHAREAFREELLALVTKVMKPENPITPGDILSEIETVRQLVSYFIMENWRTVKKKGVSDDIDDLLKGLDEE